MHVYMHVLYIHHFTFHVIYMCSKHFTKWNIIIKSLKTNPKHMPTVNLHIYIHVHVCKHYNCINTWLPTSIYYSDSTLLQSKVLPSDFQNLHLH